MEYTTSPKTISVTIAVRLRRERSRLRMTQAQFADLIGTTAARVSTWERGRCTPRLEQLSIIATKLNTEIEFHFEQTNVVVRPCTAQVVPPRDVSP